MKLSSGCFKESDLKKISANSSWKSKTKRKSYQALGIEFIKITIPELKLSKNLHFKSSKFAGKSH